jgi:alpha-glucosidase
LITEAYANLSSTLAYYQSKDGEPIAHFPFNFQLIENLHGGSNAFEFKETIDAFMYNMPAGSIANWVLGNHDKPRVGSRFGWELIDGLMALVMTLPGVAITYNGEEIGMVVCIL